jgi:hypothetical protein
MMMFQPPNSLKYGKCGLSHSISSGREDSAPMLDHDFTCNAIKQHREPYIHFPHSTPILHTQANMSLLSCHSPLVGLCIVT